MMLGRRAILSILAVAAFAFSWHALASVDGTATAVAVAQTATRSGAAGLPHVGAAAAELADQTASNISTTSDTGDIRSEFEDSLPSDIDSIEAYLLRRHTGLSKAEVHGIAELLVLEANRHGLDPSLVLAVVFVESSCYSRAVSPVGAIGLMQIMPATGEELAAELGIRWYGEETLFDPAVNLRIGVHYLKKLSDRYDNVPTALAAYNWGMGRIDRRIRAGAGVPEIYVKSVMRAYTTVGGRRDATTLRPRDAS